MVGLGRVDSNKSQSLNNTGAFIRSIMRGTSIDCAGVGRCKEEKTGKIRAKEDKKKIIKS